MLFYRLSTVLALLIFASGYICYKGYISSKVENGPPSPFPQQLADCTFPDKKWKPWRIPGMLAT